MKWVFVILSIPVIIVFIILFSLSQNQRSFLFKESKKSMEQKEEKVRPMAVQGQFYPDSEEEIATFIDNALKDAGGDVKENLRGILVPHAGYVFSGKVAARAYKKVNGEKVKTVVLIGNSHTALFSGIAIDDSDAWDAPFGQVQINRNLAEKIVNSSEKIEFNSKVHEKDHILEVQIPFLQKVIPHEFKIVPILYGNSGEGIEELKEVLKESLGENDLVVVSTDMSHYPTYEDAREIDSKTLEVIKAGDIQALDNHIESVMDEGINNEQTLLCGLGAVKTVMALMGDLGWEAEILEYKNSADAPGGDKDSVVGYGAVIFTGKVNNQNNDYNKTNMLNETQKQTLLNIARDTVINYVEMGVKNNFEIDDERLMAHEGAFVTLRKKDTHELRGCIGMIINKDRPLWEVVRDMAIAAASEDHRFEPISEHELDDLSYEVSVLSEPEEISNWEDIELGRHGVIVRQGPASGVFLPQVAQETGWSREEFLGELCNQKAGLKRDCYRDPDVKLSVFTAEVFGSEE